MLLNWAVGRLAHWRGSPSGVKSSMGIVTGAGAAGKGLAGRRTPWIDGALGLGEWRRGAADGSSGRLARPRPAPGAGNDCERRGRPERA